MIPNRFHAYSWVGLYTTGFASVKNVRDWPKNVVRERGEDLKEERMFGRKLLYSRKV